jgi:hypothetical protein
MFILSSFTATQAANFSVTTTADNGAGSLRQAINDATTNVSTNTITFNIATGDSGFDAGTNRFTITLLSALPDLPAENLTIENTQVQDVSIAGDNTFRIFTLSNTAVITLTNLTIRNGASGFAAGKSFRKLSAKNFGVVNDGLGGGIFVGDSATLTLNDCTVSNNSASINGGAIYLNNSSTMFLNRTTLNGNSAIDGAGIFVGISGTLNADASTLNNNAASGSGGGIFNGPSGTVNATNSTFNANSAAGNGGGISNAATINLFNNTISSNTADSGGGVYNGFNAATLQNNIVALNTATTGNDLFGGTSGGAGYSGTYNMIGNADGSAGVSDAPNRSGSTAAPIDPMLGPLQDNGGVTFTRALLASSPAIDKGNSTVILLDQRGVPRPTDYPSVPNEGGNGADIGAVEFQLGPTAALVSVSGQITVWNGKTTAAVSGATVYLTDSNGNMISARTNPFGYYFFPEVLAGESYVAGVRYKRYQFESRLVTVEDEMTDLNFVANQ